MEQFKEWKVIVRLQNGKSSRVILETLGKDGFNHYRSVSDIDLADIQKHVGAEIQKAREHYTYYIQQVSQEAEMMGKPQDVE